MWLARSMLMRWFWNRLTGRQVEQQRGAWGRQPATIWRTQPRQRGRGGFWGPFPYYSTRTRGGSRVTFSGCCLPLALALCSLPVLAIRAVARR
jgi:hypothetical protein